MGCSVHSLYIMIIEEYNFESVPDLEIDRGWAVKILV